MSSPRDDIVKIITWNVQGLSLRENNRRRFRRVLSLIENKKWEIVLLSEMRAGSRGVLWFGEERREMAVVHSERTAVVLRGKMMEMWRAERQRRSFSERTTTVVIGKLQCIAVYQPLWSEGREGIIIIIIIILVYFITKDIGIKRSIIVKLKVTLTKQR